MTVPTIYQYLFHSACSTVYIFGVHAANDRISLVKSFIKFSKLIQKNEYLK